MKYALGIRKAGEVNAFFRAVSTVCGLVPSSRSAALMAPAWSSTTTATRNPSARHLSTAACAASTAIDSDTLRSVSGPC